MKTRFSSLVGLKKNAMQKSERAVQKANVDLTSAQDALDLSYKSLQDIDSPQSGNITELFASRTLLASQRGIIKHNQEWLGFTKNQLHQAKEKLKYDMIEHEKYKYLELDEIKKMLKKQKIKEAKELDEIALMTYKKREE